MAAMDQRRVVGTPVHSPDPASENGERGWFAMDAAISVA